jgi:hypothetical protein
VASLPPCTTLIGSPRGCLRVQCCIPTSTGGSPRTRPG